MIAAPTEQNENRITVGPTKPLSAGLRRYLYLTSSVTGAVIMIVEILGARMLSPYVGTSHFVWTAQIAVTLVALACGYYVGGKLVNSSQKLSRLFSCICAAAVYLAMTTIFCERIAYWCLRFDLPVATLLASSLLFFIPLSLLAMTGPFLIQVLTGSVAEVGGSVGTLTSISTLGSFAGTILIGYVLVPRFPNSTTMSLAAASLILICAGYFLVWQRRNVIALLILLSGLAFTMSSATRRDHVGGSLIERFRGNSPFGMIQVLDVKNTPRRYLLNDFLSQNIYDHEQKKSTTLFTYMLTGLARTYTTNIDDVLCIGLGVGVVPMDLAREGSKVDVVEINPIMTTVAVKFFDFKQDHIKIITGDGRYYLNQCTKQYDVVILDAFLGDSTPSHLMTRNAFAAIQRVLKPNGVLVINSFGNLNSDRNFLSCSLNKTLRAVFKTVRVHSSDSETLFFVATDRPELQVLRPQSLDDIHESVRDEAAVVYHTVIEVPTDAGQILTDDFNPAEVHDARNRETLRRELAMSMKRLQ